MNLNPHIKIKLLRDIKTDALLIYIKTVIEELLENIKNETYKIDLGYQEFNNEIEENIRKLNEELSLTIINAYELKAFISYQQVKNRNQKLLPNDEALIFYYNSLVKQIETQLLSGELWIPEQIILSLLSEWILEEEKSTEFYPFLKEFNYLKLLSYYEIARNNENNKLLKENINKMYKISSSMIKKLKTSKYKINNTRKSKARMK
ncbi:MAG: hypothetical protein AB7S49_10820 [Arcobacter sp.]|jgi:hypothetical protein|uniref:Uncharacterized protein n=1 Tax=Arcobacter defluvii TaxID=873191 RepID=A0AAE7BGU2_9BACT|nr:MULTISPECIES: hypothetical protein [Arcobacter]MDY3200044.1 hypothetical protein [Arcobacter sp.]QKF78838.1 hypothetical protein ADFLV_2868 [Arcobacter defluvii]RXI30446.1 hypothetical protein CP964_11990 [Arcobacter defluvii]